MSHKHLLSALILLASLLACGRDASPPPAPEGRGPSAEEATPTEVVSEETIFRRERLWPYRVRMTKTFSPETGARPIPEGSLGALVRLVDRDRARIDFPSRGVEVVPVGATNIVESARAIAEGRKHKYGPNVHVALGPRLVDTSAESPRRTKPRFVENRVLLLVFADPDAAGFGAMARQLASLQEIEGCSAILFPPGEASETKVFERMREAGWSAPYVQPFLSEGYARGYLPGDLSPPAVLLVTAEGRRLYGSEWGKAELGRIRAAIEDTLSESATALTPEALTACRRATGGPAPLAR